MFDGSVEVDLGFLKFFVLSLESGVFLKLSFEFLLDVGIVNEKLLVLEGDIFEVEDFHIFFTESFRHLFDLVDSMSEIADLLFESGVVLGELEDLVFEGFG